MGRERGRIGVERFSDDIFCIFQANPPYLLSTIQYVNCFMGDKLEGQEQYYWTQFCAAVQFIKTMLDYGD